MEQTKTNAKDKLIVALDTSSIEDAKRLIDQLSDHTGMFKIGLELFCASGTRIFDLVKETDIQIFFDCKLKDIPNTVSQAARNIVKHNVSMFNLHASGGFEMMNTTRLAVEEEANKNQLKKPLLIAVTVLTSTSEKSLQEEQSVNISLDEQVKKLAKLTSKAGLDGVVASARESKLIREAVGDDFLIVTPGIRPEWAQANDQSRIVTPKQALMNGSSHLVVGRPITSASNIKDAYKKVVEEMEEAI